MNGLFGGGQSIRLDREGRWKHRTTVNPFAPQVLSDFARYRKDFPADMPNTLAQSPEDVVATGGSCIIGPLGEVLAGPARDGEEILYADVDLDQIARGKFDLDVVGHYSRPDIFRLSVDETPRPSVSPNQ